MTTSLHSESWDDALGDYARGANVAPETLRIRLSRLQRMSADLGGEPWAVTREQMTTWLDGLPCAAATAKEYRTAARAFYRWAVASGHMVANPIPPRPPVTRYRLDSRWQDALDLFTSAQRAGKIAPATIAQRVKHITRFATETQMPPWSVTREHLAGWLDTREVSEWSRAALRVSLRAFYRWAHSSGRIEDDPSEQPSGRAVSLGAPPNWAESVRAFRDYLRAAGRPEATVRLRIAHVERFARDHPRLDPFAVALDDLIDWQAGRHWSLEYRRSVRSTLRAFYRWAEDTGRIEASPAERLPVVKAAIPAPRPALETDYAHALAEASPRERLALRLAAELGMRRAEVAATHSGDLNRDASGWHLTVRGKGGRPRTLPLTDDLAMTLRAQPAGYVFPGNYSGHLSPHWIGKLISRLLPEGVTMHALRHRFATLAYNVDRDVFTVQQLLGHASPATTQRYVQVADDSKRRLVHAVSGYAAV